MKRACPKLYRGQGNPMSAAWKQYEGQIADGKYHLREYLGGGEWTAVFRTEVADAKRSKAAINPSPPRE